MFRILVILSLAVVGATRSDAAEPVAKRYEATWESIDSRPTPQWWSDAKFGIFIHWGVFSVPSFAPKE